MFFISFRSTPKFTVVRATTASDITFAMEYGRIEEAWPLATHDDLIYIAMAPERCYYGMLGNEKISYIQAVTYGDKEDYCYIGAYIVKKEYRHKGYGKQTWDRALSELPETCLVSLSAVPAQAVKYARTGFKSNWKEFTYTFDAQKIASLPVSAESSITIIQFKDANFSSLLKYDTSAFCYSRESYLKKVLEVPDCEGWVAMNKVGNIVGYVVARFTLEVYGWVLLPLIADDVSIAEALLVKASMSLCEQPVKRFTMTIPAINEMSVTFAQKYSEKLLFDSCRMFKGTPSDKMIENHANVIFAMSHAAG